MAKKKKKKWEVCKEFYSTSNAEIQEVHEAHGQNSHQSVTVLYAYN